MTFDTQNISGQPSSSSSSVFDQVASNFGSNSFKADEESRIDKTLTTRLQPNVISQRPGAGMVGSVMYLEGWKAIELANSIFGFNGWSSQIVRQDIDFLDNTNDRWSVGIHCTVRVTLKDGSFHQDNGYGLSENMRSKGQALEKARKEASTDALKRTLRLFGHALGNCLSDKEYTKKLLQNPSRNNGYSTSVTSTKHDPPTKSYHRPPETNTSRPNPSNGPNLNTNDTYHSQGTRLGYVNNSNNHAYPRNHSIANHAFQEDFSGMDLS